MAEINVIYLSGNTMRITATFYDFDDVLSDPDSISFTAYTSSKVEIITIDLDMITTRISEGIYQYDYIMSDFNPKKTYIIEIKGIKNGYPSLMRKEIDIEWTV